MKLLGYVIYHFWDFESGWSQLEMETNTVSPHLQYNKKIYEQYSSAEDAVKQMSKNDSHKDNTSYHILPIYTPDEKYMEMVNEYKERIEKRQQ